MQKDFYEELIVGLRQEIESQYGSVASFSRKMGVSRQNLSEVFNGHQDISVGLYMKIVSSLGVVGTSPTCPELACSLRDYLAVPFDVVSRSLITVICNH